MPVQSKFSQIYLRLGVRQQRAFANWLHSQPGSEFTLQMLAVWDKDPDVFYARVLEIPGTREPDGTDRFVRRVHYLKDALDNFLVWDRLQEKQWLQKALLAEAYGELALPEMSQALLSGKKADELEEEDIANPIELFAKYIVSKWQIHHAIAAGFTSTGEHMQRIDNNFYNVLVSCFYDLKTAIANTNRMHPDTHTVPDTNLLAQLTALVAKELYPVSENLKLYQSSYALELCREPQYQELSRYYQKWLTVHYDKNIKNNEYATTFYRALRNGFIRYCNANPNDTEALKQLWQLWTNGVEYKYALVSGFLPENEYNTLLKIARKLKIDDEEFAGYIEILNPDASRRVTRWMSDIYQLWFSENYASLAEKMFNKPLPVWLEGHSLWESCLWGIRAAFLSKLFYKDKKIANNMVKAIDKIRKETSAAVVLNLPNPRIRLFEIESKIAKLCTKARNRSDWEGIADFLEKSEPFSGQSWYKNFVKKMVQELL